MLKNFVDLQKCVFDKSNLDQTKFGFPIQQHFEGHTHNLTHIAFSPDSTTIACSSDDNAIKL